MLYHMTHCFKGPKEKMWPNQKGGWDEPVISHPLSYGTACHSWNLHWTEAESSEA